MNLTLLTQKSRVVTGPGAPPLAPGVRPTPFRAALGTSRSHGGDASISRKRFAGRSLAALAFLALSSACDPRVQGNGVYFEKTLTVGPFDGVRVENGAGAIVTIEPGLSQSVRLGGDENLIRDGHVDTALDPEGGGTVLHVWVESRFEPTISPKLIVTLPAFSLASGRGGGQIELKRPTGSTAVGGPLRVVLEGGALTARQYPTAGAEVALSGGASVFLRSDGPVTGTVAADAHLDNTLGQGPCLVTTTAAANVVCQP